MINMVCYETKRQGLLDENSKTMNHFVFRSLFLTKRCLLLPVLHIVDIKYWFKGFVIYVGKIPHSAKLTFISVLYGTNSMKIR